MQKKKHSAHVPKKAGHRSLKDMTYLAGHLDIRGDEHCTK
jgi:hypothetical protein